MVSAAVSGLDLANLLPLQLDESTLAGALLTTCRDIVVFLFDESLRALWQPVGIPWQLSQLLVAGYPTLTHMAAAILRQDTLFLIL